MKTFTHKLVLVAVAFFLGLFPITLVQAEGDESLMAWWRFDEGEGEVALDSSGNGNDAAISGAVYVATTSPDIEFENPYSLEFDGENDGVITPLSVDNYAEFTLAGWAYPRTAANNVGWFGANNVFEFFFTTDNQVRCWTPYGAVNWTYNPETFLNNWHHITCLGDGQNVILYVDGVQVGISADDPTDDYGTGDDFTIGIGVQDGGTSGPFDGYIDDVRVYSRALTPAEMASLGTGSEEPQNNPIVQTLTPSDGATNVSPGSNLILKFSTAVSIGSGDILIKQSDDDATIEAIDVESEQITGDGTDTITINPNSILAGDTEYYILIPDTAFESVEDEGLFYAGISDETTWNFTTMEAEAIGGNLVAYWRFDETTSGGAVIDSSGSNYHGTPFGALATTSVKAPTTFANEASIYFDGTNDYIDLPDGFADFTEGMTVTLWARPTAVKNWGRFFDLGNGPASDNIIVAREASSVDFYYESYRADQTLKVDATEPIVLNEWHYYTVTVDPHEDGVHATTTIYVDGEEDVSEVAYIPRNITRTLNFIARSNWELDDYYQGYMDDMRIYNRALTPEQVAALSEGEDVGGDLEAPVIDEVETTGVTNSAVDITWETDEEASSKVVYGPTAAYISATAETDTAPRVTEHAVSLSELLACTTYHYAVISTDAADNTATSSDGTFTTAGCAGDATPNDNVSQDVTAATGGGTDITNDGKTFSVTAPANATDDAASFVIQIQAIPSAGVLAALGRPAAAPNEVGSTVFDVKAIINGDTILDSFDAEITIEYEYTDEEIEGLDETTLWLYHYSGGQWKALNNCVVNTMSNTVSCTTPSFSVFGLFGQGLATAETGGAVTSTRLVCRDTAATNYQSVGRHKQELCRYDSLADTLQRIVNQYRELLLKAYEAGITLPQQVLALLGLQTTQAATETMPVRDLHKGMEGEDVRALQTLLIQQGYSIPAGASGYFGLQTEYALDAYQMANNIAPHGGYFGPITRAQMKSAGLPGLWW